jgi:hypothetical protein
LTFAADEEASAEDEHEDEEDRKGKKHTKERGNVPELLHNISHEQS